MGRQTILDDFGSRFLIPIMPVAASLTAALALRLVGKPLRSVAVATLGLIIGYATWMFTYTAIQLHRDIASAGKVLESYVTKTDGYTVAVMPFDRFESELTATIASAWPVELEKRIWVTGPKNAETEFGDRATCHPSAELNEQNRKLVRIGKLDELLWVGVAPGKPVSIKPYCLSAN
jgi:hypothetical protein